MQPASLDLVLERGDDARVTFRFVDDSASPLVLQTGEITLELGWPGGGLTLAHGDGLTVDGAAGEVLWAVTPAQLADAPLGRIATLRLVRTTAEAGRRSYAVGALTLTDGPAQGDQEAVLTVRDMTVEIAVTTVWTAGIGIDRVTGLAAALDARQPADPDLAAIAALTPADDHLLQRKAGAWTSRTPTQVKTDLAVAVGDVSGLQAALDVKAPLTSPMFSTNLNLTHTGGQADFNVVTEGANSRGFLDTHTNSAVGSAFQMRKARGTIALPLIVNNGDSLGSYFFGGHTGSAFVALAAVTCTVDDTAVTGTSIGTRLDFAVSARGGVARPTALSLSWHDGAVFGAIPIFLANQSEPATPAGGGRIYVDGGALKYKGAGGTVTTLAPA